MNINSEFEIFLSNIEPDNIYVTQASDAHTTLRGFLKNDEDFNTHFKSSFLTGSYARSTAIKEIKDVDIIIILDEEPTTIEPAIEISDIFKDLKKSLKKEYDIEQIEQQQRSVKLIWKFEKEVDNEKRQDNLTLDLVPAIRSEADSDYNLWIPDKKLEKWIKTNPKGHKEAITTRNQESSSFNGRNSFIPFVKTLKFWRDHSYKIPKRPKGFLLESLAYEYFETCFDSWIDCVLKNFKNILTSCDKYKYIESDENINFIKDIGQEGKYISTLTTYNDFKKFLEKLEDAKNQIEDALDSTKTTNKYDCIKKLQNVFGNDYFPDPKESDKNVENKSSSIQTVSILTGSSKKPEAKPYGKA
jgi:hypothetical protein